MFGLQVLDGMVDKSYDNMYKYAEMPVEGDLKTWMAAQPVIENYMNIQKEISKEYLGNNIFEHTPIATMLVPR